MSFSLINRPLAWSQYGSNWAEKEWPGLLLLKRCPHHSCSLTKDKWQIDRQTEIATGQPELNCVVYLIVSQEALWLVCNLTLQNAHSIRVVHVKTYSLDFKNQLPNTERKIVKARHLTESRLSKTMKFRQCFFFQRRICTLSQCLATQFFVNLSHHGMYFIFRSHYKHAQKLT